MITKLSSNRFELVGFKDPGFERNNKKIQGFEGYHGKLSNIIGWILEKIFHKTVGVSVGKQIYYLNCKSLKNYTIRVLSSESPSDTKSLDTIKNISDEKWHDKKFVEKLIEEISHFNKSKKEAIENDLQDKAIENDPQDNQNEALRSKAKVRHEFRNELYGNCRLKVLEEILAKGGDVNPGAGEESLLKLAISFNEKSVEIMQMLRKAGANVNKIDMKDEFPLYEAIKTGNVAAIEWLVANGADITLKKDGDKRTMREFFLQVAPHRGFDEKIVKKIVELLSTGEDLIKGRIKNEKQEKDNVELRSILVNLIGKPNFQEVLNKCTDVNPDPDRFGDPSLLSIAARSNNVPAMELLIKAGADVNKKDYNGTFPLYEAVRLGRLDAIQCLIDKDADITLKDKNNRSLREVAKEASIDIKYIDQWFPEA